MTVTYEEYTKEKIAFIRRHCKKSNCRVHTSPMVNNRYHKEYYWEDGANWYETTELISEPKVIVVHDITLTVNVEMWRTEYWSTECGSKYFYERA